MNELSHVLYVLLGAGLVWGGTLAGALADRIRGGKRARRTAACENRRVRRGAPIPAPVTDAHEAMQRDVATALVTAGYDRTTAYAAVDACAGSECATLESWTRAALRKCMKKEARS